MVFERKNQDQGFEISPLKMHSIAPANLLKKLQKSFSQTETILMGS